MQVQRQIDQLLAQRAAEWMETLKEGDARDREAFVEWLQQSKLHVDHYLDMECLDRQIESLDRAQGPDIDALLAKVAPKVVQLKPQARSENLPRARRRLVWAAAAGIAVLAFLGILGYREFVASTHRIATAIGEQRMLTLPDGSWVRMNVDTDLKIDYRAGQRNIELLSGEAVFNVARDPARPFMVRTPTADVRAVGTQFNVYQRQATVVSVLEGRVQLTTQPSQGSVQSRPVTQSLGAGEEAQVTNGRIERRRHPDVAKTVAWRERRLYFDAMPLEDIAREFNRYGGPVRLKVEGIAAGSHRFGGTFNVDDPAALADILEQQDDLIVQRGTREILIRPRLKESEPATN